VPYVQVSVPWTETKRNRKAMTSAIFPQICQQSGLPKPVAEHCWHPTRKFRADYAWPELRIILEVEGGVWSGGKHGRGSGIVKDIEKQNEAAALGWLYLRCQPKELLSVRTMEYVRQAIATRNAA